MFIYILLCEKKLVEFSRMHVEKVKRKKYIRVYLVVCLFANAFRLQSFFVFVFSEYKNILTKLFSYEK